MLQRLKWYNCESGMYFLKRKITWKSSLKKHCSRIQPIVYKLTTYQSPNEYVLYGWHNPPSGLLQSDMDSPQPSMDPYWSKKQVKSTFFPVLQIYKLDGADNFKTLATEINVWSPLFKCLEFNHSKCRVKTQIVN